MSAAEGPARMPAQSGIQAELPPREQTPWQTRLQALGEAGAAGLDPLGWHHAQALARRMAAGNAAVQPLLQARLTQLLDALAQRLQAAPDPVSALTAVAPAGPAPQAGPSPLARLLQDMATPAGAADRAPAPGWRPENPRVRQFRQQLRQISVQRQVRQAMAQAPQNAGPINSHMLVLRALGLMRDISPAYLQRFMTHVDTLLCLQEADKPRPAPRSRPAPRAKR